MRADDVLVFGFPGVRRARMRCCATSSHTPDRPRYARRDRGLYGNRDFDDALLEAADLLGERGFDVVAAAGAFIGEHSLTARVGTGRPDDADVKPQRSASAERWRAPGARKPPRPNPPSRETALKELKPGADVRPITTDACIELRHLRAQLPARHHRRRRSRAPSARASPAAPA